MTQEPRLPDVRVKLAGHDGNAFAILGAVSRALKKAGVDPGPYVTEATDGDYEHLLRVTMQWVDVA